MYQLGPIEGNVQRLRVDKLGSRLLQSNLSGWHISNGGVYADVPLRRGDNHNWVCTSRNFFLQSPFLDGDHLGFVC